MTRRSMTCVLLPMLIAGCVDLIPIGGDDPIETSFAFTNFSRTQYAQLAIRRSGEDAFVMTPLLAPGVTHRQRFLDALGVTCPASVDLQLMLYDRLNGDVPIGEDDGESVSNTPVTTGEVLDVPACEVVVVETLTIVNWDAPPGTGVVKIAQGTPLENVLASLTAFDHPDGAWSFEGISDDLTNVPPEPLAENQPIAGRVVTADGNAVDNVGVLLRTRFRVRLNDDDPSNDPDVGFGEPIAVTSTNEAGRFSFDRPAGAYRVELFSDDFLFRPAIIDVESPVAELVVVAEPVQ